MSLRIKPVYIKHSSSCLRALSCTRAAPTRCPHQSNSCAAALLALAGHRKQAGKRSGTEQRISLCQSSRKPWHRYHSGWGTVATRGRRLSPLYVSVSSCSSKLQQTEALNPRANGLRPWPLRLPNLVSYTRSAYTDLPYTCSLIRSAVRTLTALFI